MAPTHTLQKFKKLPKPRKRPAICTDLTDSMKSLKNELNTVNSSNTREIFLIQNCIGRRTKIASVSIYYKNQKRKKKEWESREKKNKNRSELLHFFLASKQTEASGIIIDHTQSLSLNLNFIKKNKASTRHESQAKSPPLFFLHLFCAFRKHSASFLTVDKS